MARHTEAGGHARFMHTRIGVWFRPGVAGLLLLLSGLAALAVATSATPLTSSLTMAVLTAV